MKTIRISTSALMQERNKRRQRRKARFVNPSVPLFTEPANQNLIQWPSEKQIMEVSKQLVKIARMGIRSEASGDYFNSGDLAYQMQEIIRSTAELFQRVRRIRR